MLINRLPSGGGKKSLILPNNITDITAKYGDAQIELTWTIPSYSEVEIKAFNIYVYKSDNEPTNLKDFTKVATVDATTTSYTITGLENESNYYVIVESISAEGYENASLLGLDSCVPSVIPLRFVAVGDEGKSYYSLDGETWTSMSGLSSETFLSVAYGNGVYVAVTSGYAYYSLDGKTWSVGTGLSTSYIYRGVAYGNGRFVTVGASGKSYYSLDGITWNAMNGLDTSQTYHCVKYINKRFVAVGSAGKTAYSLDGITWTTMADAGENPIYGIAYGNSKYVCVGHKYCYYSTDGETWTKVDNLSSSVTYQSIVYANGIFIVVGSSATSYYSLDGETWNTMSGLDSAAYYEVTYAEGRFVCVGGSGETFYSLDGKTWNTMSGTSSSYNLFAVCSNKLQRS